jgi:hypothetical protein
MNPREAHGRAIEEIMEVYLGQSTRRGVEVPDKNEIREKVKLPFWRTFLSCSIRIPKQPNE